MSRFADDALVALFEASPDALVRVHADGRIALVNRQAEALFGYEREELTGQFVEVLMPEAARRIHPQHRATYLSNPRPRLMGTSADLAGRRRDGSTFPAKISLSAVNTDGGMQITAVIRDITGRLRDLAERETLKTEAAREEMELKLQQSQRLESLGQLAGGVAHDFNNLLSVISNYSAFVREEVAKDPARIQWQEVRNDIEQVEGAAARAAGLTRQLLAFARREVPRPRVFSVNELIIDLRQLLVRTLGEHVELVTTLNDDACGIFADRGQIEQVLVNLAVNARDAMPAGGTLTIETATTDVDDVSAASHVGLRPGRYVRVKVSDTGTGIPKAVMNRVFEPFFSTKPKSEGTGLGLATAYGIIQQAGGDLHVYSEEGLGATVAILLPVSSRPVQEDQVPEPDHGGGEGQVVLVVEDEAPMRDVIRRLLVRNGYEVLVVASGREAIDLVTSHEGRIDLMITDVVMPRMLGKEVADQVGALRPGMSVLFMSGYTQGVLGPQGVLAPGLNLIEKPFTEATLMRKLREVQAERRRASSGGEGGS
jgi:PAS domain S-box-containing protein